MSRKTKPRKTGAEADPLAGADRLRTLGEWLEFALGLYRRHRPTLGQVAADPHDEALYLLLRGLDLPLDSGPDTLDRPVDPAGRARLRELLRRRVIERVPAAYLTREAWLDGLRFHVDERVIIPRSYFLELIPGHLEPWLPRGTAIRRVADVCTGSGCLAVLLARCFPSARVDAIELAPGPMAVARINVRAHRLTRRIALHRSDLFARVPRAKYDIIISNPPYEPSGHVDQLPPEFRQEPRLALDGGPDGMDIVRRLLQEASARLQPHGILVIEVGGLREAVDREFGRFEPHWLPTADGADCVVLFQAARLRTQRVRS